MSINPPNIPPFTHPVKPPVTNITPFTYRDGWTFLEMIESLRGYIFDLAPQLQGILDTWQQQYVKDYAALVDDVNNAKELWEQFFADFRADVVAQIAVLNDEAVADLVDDPSSEAGAKLRELFASRADAILVNPNPVFYVNPETGDDMNNGSQSSPFRTIQHATDVAVETVTRPDTPITIHLAAGTYAENVQIREDVGTFTYDLQIKGPDVGGHPITPVAIISRGDDTPGIGFGNRNQNVNVTLENVLIQGYNSSGVGVLYAKTTLNNVHIIDCGKYGVDHFSGVLTMPDGLIRDCETGIRSIMLNRHNIGRQNNGHRVNTLRIQNCSTGFHAQESSTGHVDYVSIGGCNVGINTYVNSRVNATGTVFTDVLVAFRAESNGNILSQDNEFERVQTRFIEWNGGYLQDQTQIFGDMTARRSSVERHGGANYDRWKSTTSTQKFFSQKLDGAWFQQGFRHVGNMLPTIKTRSVMKISGSGEKRISIMHFGHNSPVTLYGADNGHVLVETETKFLGPNEAIITMTVIPHGSNNPRFIILESTRPNDKKNTEIALGAYHSEEGASVEVLYTEMSRIH